jgi:hypothetical protein
MLFASPARCKAMKKAVDDARTLDMQSVVLRW